MAKRTKTRRSGGALRAKLVKKRGGGTTLVFSRNAASSAPRKPRKGSAAYKEQRRLAMRAIADSSRVSAAETSRAVAKDSRKRKARATRERKYAAHAKTVPQWGVTSQKKKARVAFGPFKRWNSPRDGRTYGYVDAKSGKIKKIPTWAVAGAHSARAFADPKFDGARSRITKQRAAAKKRASGRFSKTTRKLQAQIKALEAKQARELKRIEEGKSIMAPNRRKKGKSKSKSKGRAKGRVSAKRRAAAKRGAATRKRRLAAKRASSKRAHKRSRSRKASGYRMKANKRSRTRSRSRKRARRSSYAIALRSPIKRRSVRRRRSFKRNGAFDPIMAAIRTGAPALGGFALHRIATGLLASAVGPSLTFLPEAAKVPLVGLAVAAFGAFGAKAAIKGEAGNLVVAGMGVSFLHQAVMALLRYAGQDGAVSYLAGIPSVPTTGYGRAMGAYELVGNGGGVNGFGAFPYSQAAAGYGELPYSQALAGAGNPFAARGTFMDVPSLGAYPEQAMAGAYPEQAAAGIGGGQMGAYELTEGGGGTFDGIGTDDASIHRALDFADRSGAVNGFGADTVGRMSILTPDGAQASITGGPELPMVSGIFGNSSLSVPFD